MTDLPSGWEWTTLGQVAETSLGKMLDRGKFTGSNGVPYLRNINVKWGRFDLNDILTIEIPPEQQSFFELRPGDLIVCEGGEIGRCAVWPGSAHYMAFQKALHRLRPHSGVDAHFLRYLFEYYSHTNALASYSTGSTIKHLPQQQLRKLPLPLPPHAEQRHIVDSLEIYLSSVADGQRQVTHAKRRLRHLEVMLLRSAVERRSPHWEDVRIGELARVTSGATPRRGCAEYYDHGSIPWITSSQLNRPFVENATQFITEKALKETTVKLLGPGTLLLAMYGEGRTRGKCSELTFSATTNQACAAIEMKSDFVGLRPWLKMALEARYEANRRLSSGGVQPNLNLGLIKEIVIPLPPAEERKDILAELDVRRAVNARLESDLTKMCNRADALRRTLLLDAFSGRLAPQDPSDEPASVLLERIREERMAQPKTRRPRRSQENPDHEQGSSL